MPSDAERRELERQIGDALAIHTELIDRVVAVAKGTLEPASLDGALHEDTCAFGRWLDGPIAPALRATPAFWLAKARHATFHRQAATIVDAARRNDPAACGMVGSATGFGENAKLLRAVLHEWTQHAFLRAG